MRATSENGKAPFTTIAGYRVRMSRLLFFRGKALLRALRRLPGLISAAIFRSYDRRSVMIYLQWANEASAESGIASKQYKASLARLGRTIFPPTLCESQFL